MTAADYCDWCTYAGLYVQNVSHADRYRTYQGKISRQGLAVKIVLDLLENNKGGLDLQTWRNSDVYEFGDDATYRVEQTALALEAVGAPRPPRFALSRTRPCPACSWTAWAISATTSRPWI
jgi:hypothetical protein